MVKHAPPARFSSLALAALIAVATVAVGTPSATAADDAVVETRPRHWHAPAGADLAAYDLDAECTENARKRDARQAFNVACFMLRDFMNAYHPGEEFTWQRAGNHGFGYVGTRQPDDRTHQEVFVRWQSFSDGLQWGFSETEITRDLGDDPFRIVADAAARDRIRAAVGPGVGAGPCDVFLQRTRQVMTDARTEGIAFPPAELAGDRYGVFVDGRARFFTPAGEPIEEPRRQ